MARYLSYYMITWQDTYLILYIYILFTCVNCITLFSKLHIRCLSLCR